MKGWPIEEVWLPRTICYRFVRGRMVRSDPRTVWERKLYRRCRIDYSRYRPTYQN